MTKVDLQILVEKLGFTDIQEVIAALDYIPSPRTMQESYVDFCAMRSMLLHVLRFIKQTTAD